MTLEQAYTADQVAESLNVSTWWVQEQVRRGRVSCLRVGPAHNAPMRFETQHIDALKALMAPPPIITARKRRRRRSA